MQYAPCGLPRPLRADAHLFYNILRPSFERLPNFYANIGAAIRAQCHGGIALSPEENSLEERGFSEAVRTDKFVVQQYRRTLHLKVRRVLSL